MPTLVNDIPFMRALFNRLLSLHQKSELPGSVITNRMVRQWICPLLPPEGEVLVVAARGKSLLPALLQAVPTGTVHVWEPVSDIYTQLRRDFSQKGNLRLYCQLAGDREEVQSYVQYFSNQVADAATLSWLNGHSDQMNILVKARPIDSAWDQGRPLRAIVLDRGLALLRVLRGAEETLLNHRPAVLMTWKPDLDSTTENAEIIWQMMENLGYRIYLASGDSPALPLTHSQWNSYTTGGNSVVLAAIAE